MSDPGQEGGNVIRCAICGFVVDQRYEATKPTIEFKMGGRGKLAVIPEEKMWKCKGRISTPDGPGDCGWPTCGCDPHASRVIEHIGECGQTLIDSATLAGYEALAVSLRDALGAPGDMSLNDLERLFRAREEALQRKVDEALALATLAEKYRKRHY